jgi:hypothetical protein
MNKQSQNTNNQGASPEAVIPYDLLKQAQESKV